VTDTTPGKILVLLEVTFHTEHMTGTLERRYPFRHASLAIVTGFAFFYFLPSDIINHFPVGTLAMMTAVALQPLMLLVR